MTPASGFDLHPEAARDITEIREDIATNNPAAAGRVREDILQAIRNLLPFPHSGHRRSDLTDTYAPDEDPLWIVAVIHGHRDPRIMAAILRGREQHGP